MNTEVKAKGGQPALPPIGAIFTSVPVLALFAAQALNNYGFATLMNGIPTYLNDVQGLPLDKVRLDRQVVKISNPRLRE